MDIKAAFGAASILITVIGYVPYVRDIFSGRTKPHALSWLVWAVLASIAFVIQLVNDGGAGSWLMGLTAVATLSIFFLSLQKGESDIFLVDWLSLVLAGVALALWPLTDEPLFSVLLISAIDAIGGFFPTFRKSYRKPSEETASLYLVYSVSLGLSLAALDNFDLVNALYPASFVFINLSMVGFLCIRRWQLARSSAKQQV